MKSAYRDYANKVIFPAIVSRICDQRCLSDCPVNMALRDLEYACVTQVEVRDAQTYALPRRKGSVAVIGGGLSGMACAQKLAVKKYQVTVFEQSDEPGGDLFEVLPGDLIRTEFDDQFRKVEHEIVANRRIVSLDALAFSAVYIATGAGGNDFGLLDGWNAQSLATVREGTFLGGLLVRNNRMDALADGIVAAASIERYLKIGSMSGQPESFYQHECLLPVPEKMPESAPLKPANGEFYSAAEASEEAARCLLCDCTKCYDTCEFMKSFRYMPKRVEVESLASRATEQGLVDRVGTKMIVSCALCGHCKAVCDHGVDVEKLMRESKRHLFNDGALAPAFHDFYMRDMAESMGDAYLAKAAPGADRAQYVFFPGCQSLGSDVESMEAMYRYMLGHHPDTALMLACCGVPALYGGEVRRMVEVHEKILEDWRLLGKPVMVTACPSCAKNFAEFLPEIECISAYEYLITQGLPEAHHAPTGIYAVFDPCASRTFPAMQAAVRELCTASGMETAELPETRERTLCCGMGGHIYAANPALSGKMTETATGQSGLPYIAYCTNCKNRFLSSGKSAVHILDILFGVEPRKSALHIAEKRRNRLELKARLLASLWGEKAEFQEESPMDAENRLVLNIPEALLQKMDKQLISEDDVYETITFSEQEDLAVVNASSGTKTGHKRIGIMTYWVEYRREGDTVDVANVYSHRLHVLEKGR